MLGVIAVLLAFQFSQGADLRGDIAALRETQLELVARVGRLEGALNHALRNRESELPEDAPPPLS